MSERVSSKSWKDPEWYPPRLVILFASLFVIIELMHALNLAPWFGKEVAEGVHAVLLALAVIGLGLMKITLDHLREQISSSTRKSQGPRVLVDKSEIESAARLMIRRCQSQDGIIQATEQFLPNETVHGLSEDYFEAIALKIAKAKKKHHQMIYRVVIPAEDSPAVRDAVRLRWKIFKRHKVEHNIEVRRVPGCIPLEILLAGHSALLALQVQRGDEKYEVGFEIEDHPSVERIAEWYRDNFWKADTKNLSLAEIENLIADAPAER